MENETFRTRLLRLLQKSRQAFRLYESMGRSPRGDGAEFTEMQAVEWRNVNAELIKELSLALDHPNPKELTPRVLVLRDRMLSSFRTSEAEVHSHQKELVYAAEKGDFVKSALLSRRLVVMKARAQASQAVHHELDEVVSQSRLTQPPIVLSEQIIEPETVLKNDLKEARLAPVIPLRKRQVSGA